MRGTWGFRRSDTVRAVVGAVHALGGRRGRPRGRPDPPDGFPGPHELKEEVHPRARGPIWPPWPPSGAIGDGRPMEPVGTSHPVNHVMSLAAEAATLACASFHIVEWA